MAMETEMRPDYMKSYNPFTTGCPVYWGGEKTHYVADIWVTYALICLALAGAGLALPIWLGAPLVLVFILLFVDFTVAAVRFQRHHYLGPIFERTIGWRVGRWWDRFSSPARFMLTCDNSHKLARSYSLDFFEIFDEDGYLLGTEQEIDWKMSNTDPMDDHPSNVQVIKTSAEKPYRLSWLARRRSREAFAEAKRWQNRFQKAA